jgi:hypothetical protein
MRELVKVQISSETRTKLHNLADHLGKDMREVIFEAAFHAMAQKSPENAYKDVIGYLRDTVRRSAVIKNTKKPDKIKTAPTAVELKPRTDRSKSTKLKAVMGLLCRKFYDAPKMKVTDWMNIADDILGDMMVTKSGEKLTNKKAQSIMIGKHFRQFIGQKFSVGRGWYVFKGDEPNSTKAYRYYWFEHLGSTLKK